MSEAALAVIDSPLPRVFSGNAITPMAMLSQAVERGDPTETIAKLMVLQERWEASQARKAFDAALAAAKAEIPVIAKNRRVSFRTKTGTTEYSHEDMGEIARTVDPILARHGLSYRFRTTSEINQPIVVTCIVAHRDGHSEENSLTAGRDDSGQKNAIQQVGSTITYLQRYTLKAALGLAAAADDDGASAGPDLPVVISDAQIGELTELMQDVGADRARFLNHFQIETLVDMPADRFQQAVTMLNGKRR